MKYKYIGLTNFYFYLLRARPSAKSWIYRGEQHMVQALYQMLIVLTLICLSTFCCLVAVHRLGLLISSISLLIRLFTNLFIYLTSACLPGKSWLRFS